MSVDVSLPLHDEKQQMICELFEGLAASATKATAKVSTVATACKHDHMLPTTVGAGGTCMPTGPTDPLSCSPGLGSLCSIGFVGCLNYIYLGNPCTYTLKSCI